MSEGSNNSARPLDGQRHRTPPTFLNLPINARRLICKHVLSVPHPLYLFLDQPSLVRAFAPDAPRNWLALLYTNRQLGSEASAVLYEANHFYMMDDGGKDATLVREFLNQIGPLNARALTHSSMAFPVLEATEHSFRIREDCVQNLLLLQARCGALSTLEMIVERKNSAGITRTEPGKPYYTSEALSMVDRQLKGISFLRKIVVRIFSPDPNALVMETMRGFGWLLLDNDTDSEIE